MNGTLYFRFGDRDVHPAKIGSAFLFHQGFRAKIAGQSESFIPTRMKVVNIQDSDSQLYKNGLDSFNGAGAYLVQDYCILKDLRSQVGILDIEKIPFDNEESFFQNPKLVTFIDESNSNYYDKGITIVLCINSTNGTIHFHYTSLSCYQIPLSHYVHDAIDYVMPDRTAVKIPRSSVTPTINLTSLFIVDEAQNQRRLSSYMLFRMASSTSNPTGLSLDNFIQSFQHTLTSSGADTLHILKTLVFRRFKTRQNSEKNYYCIVSLFQSSGSGKSKLCCELVYTTPGFHVVLRSPGEVKSAYPQKNNISDALMNIFLSKEIQEPVRLTRDGSWKQAISGHCLHLIAKIAVTYFNKAIELVLSSVDSEATLEERVLEAIRRVRSNVDDDFELCSDDEMFRLYGGICQVNDLAAVSIDHVSIFIASLCSKVERGLLLPSNESTNGIVAVLNRMLSQYPYVFVLDEAPYLANPRFTNSIGSKSYSGLQLFYRALECLPKSANLIVLTLGTKSTLQDLNPEQIETSSRPSGVTHSLRPIVLSGNSDIHTEEICKVHFYPTHSTLKNPLTFKELTGYGHALWSSIPFDQVMDTACMKLNNGNLTGYNMIPSLWMVRSGIRAAPETLFASELVANRMATAFDVDEKLEKYHVYYPSDPNLALGARHFTDTTNLGIKVDTTLNRLDSSRTEMLFAGLLNMLSYVIINRGEYAEHLAGMSSLKAIDEAECEAVAASVANYELLLKEMTEACPQLSHVWTSKRNLLEFDSPATNPIKEFKGYHVVSVKSFLLSQFGPEIAPQLAKFPGVILEGLINASHMVKLDRNLDIDTEKTHAMHLPSCDEIPSSEHNIIDRSLLCYGLRRQCGFYFPDRYPALDYFFPVCLNKLDSKGRPIYTFIGVQVKAQKDINRFDINRMSVRYHYVKCPHLNHPEHSASCAQCEDDESMQLICSNQISIVISLDGKEKTGSWSEVSNLSGLNLTRQEVLKEIYPDLSLSFDRSADKKLSVKKTLPKPASTFFDVTRINGHLDIAVSAWKDMSEVERRKVPKSLNASASAFSSASTASTASSAFDKMHTIVWRGMSNFKRLFKHENSIKNATAILAQDNPPERIADFDRYLLSMLREGKHNLPAYNEVLQAWREYPQSTEYDEFNAFVSEYFDAS